MKRNLTTAILAALALIAIVPNARAEIASKAYVDDGLSGKMNTMTIDSAPTDSSANLVSSGGVAAAIAAAITSATYDDTELKNRLDKLGGQHGNQHSIEYTIQRLAYGMTPQRGYDANAIITTDLNGVIRSTAGSFLTNNHISQNANIDIAKLHMPTPPAACSTQGCMLMFYNDQYVWEPISRDSNETIPTTGAIAANNPTQIQVKYTEARDADYDITSRLICENPYQIGEGDDENKCVDIGGA